jgi:dipeptidyl aminopeptidase/acylaminoacyl peptidase
MKWTAALVLILLVLLPAGLLGVGWIGSERAIHPGAATYEKNLPDFPALHPQEFRFASRTHATIAASFYPGARPATIVLSHGYGDNQAEMLPYADFLHAQGFSIVTYDMRNRGRSTGDAVTLGALEYLDLISVIDQLMIRPDVDHGRIAAMGVSLGGSTTVMSAANDPRIRAVVDDSGFSDAPNVIETSFEHFIGLPAFPFAPITVFLVRLRTGLDPNQVQPQDVIARISPRPLLIIHCMGDTVVPPANSERMFAAARQPKQFWRVPHGSHADAHDVARAEYERRVSEFLDEALR